MERSATRDIIVGLFLIVGIAAIAYLSIRIGGFAWQGREGFKLFALFNETGDLTVRAPVVIDGVKIGEVRDITLVADKNGNYHARVDLDVDPKVKLDEDTEASIVTAGMLGDRYIELQPGGGDEYLKSGGEITHTNMRGDFGKVDRATGLQCYQATAGTRANRRPVPGK